jgi:hypothetical protein
MRRPRDWQQRTACAKRAVGSFWHGNHRGRLPRGKTLVAVFGFDAADVAQRDGRNMLAYFAKFGGLIRRLRETVSRTRQTTGKLDNKIAKKCLAGRRPFGLREMTCDTANPMLGFL